MYRNTRYPRTIGLFLMVVVFSIFSNYTLPQSHSFADVTPTPTPTSLENLFPLLQVYEFDKNTLDENGWDSRMDFNNDGVVDVKDLIIFLKAWHTYRPNGGVTPTPSPQNLTPTATPTQPPTPTWTPTPVSVPSGQTITVPLTLPAGAKPLEMVLIPAGSFIMGSPNSEKDRYPDEGPQHWVTISKDFYMGKYEVTQAQWQAVRGSNPANGHGVGNNYPVYYVSWNDCQTFIQKLNQLGQGTYRLPTEAEWEYACRAGTKTRFYWGDDPNYTQIGEYAWYYDYSSSNSKTHEVGLKKPNAWGLFDMSGNVWEWCQDWYGSYSSNAQNDPTGANSGIYRVLRGGSFGDLDICSRSAIRESYFDPDFMDNLESGFRLCRTQ